MVGFLGKFIDVIESREFKIFWIIFFVYMLNQRVVSSNDVTPTRLLPISIIREGNFDLNEFTFLYKSGEELPYFLKNVDGRIVSTYPVFTSILAVPVYLIPTVLGLDSQSNNVFLLSKLAAALMTTLSALFIYWTVRRLSSEKTALVVTTVCAFGTANWPISSQDLWQHGPGELFIAMTVYLLVRGLKEERYVRYSGLTLATAVAIRPTNLVTALAISLYVFIEHRKQFRKYVMYATPVAAALFLYSITYLHSIFLLGQLQNPKDGWGTPLLEGLLGLLVSPNRGLFIYSPVLILTLFGMLGMWRSSRIMRYFTIATLSTIIMWSKYGVWYSSDVYGSRYLIEVIPFLCIFLSKPVEIMLEKPGLRIVLAVLIAISIFINFIGVVEWDGSWGWKHRIQERTGSVQDGVSPTSREDTDYLKNLWWDTSDMEWAYYTKRFFARILG